MRAQQDEARRLRIRDAALVDEFGRRGRDQTFGMPCLLGQTKKIASYPTVAQSFYACAPSTLLGAEVEGGAGTVTPGPSTFLALNLGSVVPPIGTNILATFVDSRWVFRFDG
jgi:hypothetical protein